MNNGEAYASLRSEGLTHDEAEAELTLARRGRGRYLSWSVRRGYTVRYV